MHQNFQDPKASFLKARGPSSKWRPNSMNNLKCLRLANTKFRFIIGKRNNLPCDQQLG